MSAKSAPKATSPGHKVELEFLEGLEPFVTREISRELEGRIGAAKPRGDSSLTLTYRGNLKRLLELKTIVAAYQILSFKVVRPRSLLDAAPFKTIVTALKAVVALHPAGACKSFRLSAAGSDSATIQRFRASLAQETGLEDDEDDGDVLLRLRRAGPAWELLIRLSPRPLSTRSWRVANMPGALNATVAAALFECIGVERGERFLNAMCGSGSILIERLARHPLPETTVGFDITPAAMRASTQNIARANLKLTPILLRSAAESLPFRDGFFDVICADLPWGERVGKRKDNAELYEASLRELTRVSRNGARLVLLTQDTASLESVLRGMAGDWIQCWKSKISQGGYHPTLYVFERRSQPKKPTAKRR